MTVPRVTRIPLLWGLMLQRPTGQWGRGRCRRGAAWGMWFFVSHRHPARNRARNNRDSHCCGEDLVGSEILSGEEVRSAGPVADHTRTAKAEDPRLPHAQGRGPGWPHIVSGERER